MTNPIFVNEKPTRCISEFDFIHDPSDKNSKLGTGSFASVKLAKDKKTGRLHALKMISLHPTKTNSSDLHNTRTEISIHRKIDHPNIIKFYDYCQKDHNIYLVLDYAENGNLYSYIHKRKGGLPQDEIFRFFHQTCLAFQYLHQNDILHRDLKPENLLLDKNHDIKLCDFGWSTRRIMEKRMTFCGTYEYMAPEIVHKKPYDYRVDIWSLGILLYELIHREAPYKGRSLSEISKSLTKPHITFSSNTHPEAKDLIQRILKTNPNDRLSIDQILSHPWVKLHLPKDIITETQVSELVSERDVRPATTFHNIYADSSKYISRRNKENFKSEIITNIDNCCVISEVIPPQSKKNANSHLFSSFTGTTFREKDTERARERERPFSGISADNTMLNHSDTQRRKPLHDFSSNVHLKTISENLVSARGGHTKSSSSLTGSALDKLIFDERKTPNSGMNKKMFENNNVLSPNFRTKVNNIVTQLSSQTTTNKSSRDLNGFFGSKIINQHTTRHGYSGVTSPMRHYEHQLTASQKLDALAISRTKSDLRAEEVCQISTSSSSNTSKNRIDVEVTRRVKTPTNAKSNVQMKINLPRGEDFSAFSSPLSNANKTARSKMGAKSPEPTDLRTNPLYMSQKFSNGDLGKSPHSRRPENVYSSNHENRLRNSKEGLGFSFNNFYKSLDYKKKQAYKLNGDNMHSGSKKTLLNERKREALKDKENHFMVKEEPLRNWAF